MSYHDKLKQDTERAVYLLSEDGIDCQLDNNHGDLDLLITLSDGVIIRIGCDIYEQLVFSIEE